jgi:pimeloyl-ACP methyl ester carboxylesterase
LKLIKQDELYVNIEGVNGKVRLHYVVSGNGPDLLLLHGLGSNIYCWRKIIPLLEDKFRVWAVDLQGFGKSDKPLLTSYSLKNQSLLLGRFTHKVGIKKAVIVGNSMGSSIAVQMAIDWPRLTERLVLINYSHDKRVFGPPLNALRTVSKAAASLVGLVAPSKRHYAVSQYMSLIYGDNHEIHQEDIDAYAAPYIENNESYFTFLASLHALTRSGLSKTLATLSTPVHILWGKNDKLLPEAFSQKLLKEIPGSTYSVHPWGGHHLQEEDPNWVADQISNY